MSDDPYQAVSTAKWQALEHAFRGAPQTGGRFSGLPAQQRKLAQQMRELFIDPGDDTLMLLYDDVLGLADDLDRAEPHWSIGQFSSALASLMKGE